MRIRYFAERALRIVVLSLLVLGLSAVPSSAQPAEESPTPVLTPDEMAVSVSGATPEGDVVVFGMGRDRVGAVPRVLRLEHRLTTDVEGSVRWELDEPVMPHSVWAVVDVASGEYSLASPQGHALERVELPAEGLGANARFLERDGRFLDLLLVRPAVGPGGEEEVGFWGVALGDGAGLDADGEANSRLSVDLSTLLPLEDSPPPSDRLRPKDVLIGVDPKTLVVFATRLADGPVGAAVVGANQIPGGGSAGEGE